MWLFKNYPEYLKILEGDIDLILKEIKEISLDIERVDYVYKELYTRKYLYKKIENTFPEHFFESFRNDFVPFSTNWLPENNIDFAGRLLVQKRNYERKILLAGTYLKQDNYLKTDVSDEQIKIQLPNRKRIDGYVHFYGNSIGDDLSENRNTLRFYFNFNPEAKDFLHSFKENFANAFFAKLNKRKIPFHIKFRKELASYHADSTVLYLERRYLISFLDILYENYYANKFSIKPILRDETPMFTYPLLPGIGFAEGIASLESGLESFGKQKTNLTISLCESETDPKSVLKKIENSYRKDKLIFLNELSKYEYRYKPELVFQNFYLRAEKRSDAVLIGYAICKEAFWDDNGRCNWIRVVEQNKYAPLQIGYMDGLGGILLFLTELFTCYGNTLFKRYAIGTIETIFSKMEKQSFEFKMGFHAGTGSVLYVLFKAIKVFSLEKIYTSRLQTLTQKYTSIDWLKEIAYDVFGGLSGNLLSLLLIKKKSGNDTSLNDSINQVVELILKKENLWEIDSYMKDKISIQEVEATSLTGLAHGFTGIAYVLAFYQKIMPDANSSISNLIEDSLLHEEKNRRFENVWIDASASDNELPSPMIYWEYGLLGAAYSRIGIMKLSDKTKFQNWQLLENGIKNVINYVEHDKKSYGEDLIKRIGDGTLDFLIECVKLKLKTSEEVKSIIKPMLNLFHKQNLELNEATNISLFVKIEENSFDESEIIKDYINPTLIGDAGLGMSILRLEKPKLVDSYILPS
jgi:hypothetical protein